MPNYKYSGINLSGKRVKGTLEAINQGQVTSFLRRNGISVVSMSKKSDIDFQTMLKGDKVSADDVILFTRLLSGALKNGMNLKEALEVIYRQVNVPMMKKVILKILNDIKGGVDMSATLSSFPKVFPAYYAPLIKAGEAIGDLPGVLDQVGEYMEKVNDLIKEIKSMLTYPAVVLSLGLCLVSVVLVKVMPTFKKVFAEMGNKAPLPLPTQILNNLSDFVVANWQTMIITVIVTVVSSVLFGRTRQGKYFFSAIMLKAPFIGPIVTAMIIISFLKTMATLTKNKVPIVQTLNIVQNSTKNVIIQDIIKEMKTNVVKGFTMAAPLHQNSDIFPPMIAYAVDIGERSGNLGEVLEESAKFYDKQSVYELKQLSAKVDPILTMLIGGLVLWVAMAIYLPMFQMISTAAG